MKYVLFCMAAAVLCFGIGYLIACLIRKFIKKPIKKTAMAFLSIGCGIAFIAVIFLLYFSVYYHAGDKAKAALKGSDTVSVKKIDGGYLFDGPSDDTALVFCPGAKVESEAYAPLMLKLASDGIDCFLADVPFRFAPFRSNVADKFLQSYDYPSWIMAGHSMGGVVASGYANKHTDKVKGIVFLASYSTQQIENSIKVCSIYGTEDGCLQMDSYVQGKVYWPKESIECIIEGGNHAQFGEYGIQSGDGTATISAEEQQQQTADTILLYFA